MRGKMAPAVCLSLIMPLGSLRTSELRNGIQSTVKDAFATPASKSHPELLDDLEVLKGKTETLTYHGRRAIHLVPSQESQAADDSTLAILRQSDFQDGVIEVDVAGAPRPGTPEDSRGFIGIAFRVQAQGSKYENLYLRPTNGRADDQLRRNHSVQYTSEPDYPWYRLRKEAAGIYESYADLEPGEWMHMKIVVSGTNASLYVNRAAQPCLIVKDLKLGKSRGQIALWAHWTTEAYFSKVTVSAGAE